MQVEFNLHGRDFRNPTIEFNVKNPAIPASLTEDVLEWEYATGHCTNLYADELFGKLVKRYKWMKDWGFAGRSNGWFVIEIDKDPTKIRKITIDSITKLVVSYYKGYGERLAEFYKEFA